MRTTTWPAISPSEMTPVSVTPVGPSQRMGMQARANASSANFLQAMLQKVTAYTYHRGHQMWTLSQRLLYRSPLVAPLSAEHFHCALAARGSAIAPDCSRLSSADHEVVRHSLLQHEPHAVHIITGMPPVALRIQISQQQTLLLCRQECIILSESRL